MFIRLIRVVCFCVCRVRRCPSFSSPVQALTGYVQPYSKSAVSACFLLLQCAARALSDWMAGRRICPRWLSTQTGTGRLSCRGPNLQALPRNADKPGLALADEGETEGAEGDEDEDDELVEVDATGAPIVGAGPAATAAAAAASAAPSAGAPPAARTVTLKSLVRMRDVIVPTPAPLAAAIRAHRFARWNAELRCVEIPTDTIAELLARPQNQEERASGAPAAGPDSGSMIDAAGTEAHAQPMAPASSSGGGPTSLSLSTSTSVVPDPPALQTYLSGLRAPSGAVPSLSRQLEVAGEQRVLMCADYNQMEVRLLAQLCGDEGLIRSFVPEADQGMAGESDASAGTAEQGTTGGTGAAAAAGSADAATGSAATGSAAAAEAPATASAAGGSDVYRSMAAQIFHGGDVGRVTDAQRVIAKTIVLGLVGAVDQIRSAKIQLHARTRMRIGLAAQIGRLTHSLPIFDFLLFCFFSSSCSSA